MELIKSIVPESDWKAMIERIKRGKCLLMIGPECSSFYSDSPQNSLLDLLSGELEEHKEKENGSYRNLFQITENYLRSNNLDSTDLSILVSEFYKSRQGDQSYRLYDNLAELPFHLVISSTHDNLLYYSLKKKKDKVYYDYYSIYGDQKQIEFEGTVKTPLYYNLYGSIENTDSLILTESQLLEFLIAIIKGDPMLPSYITEQIRNIPSILFLGFGLKEWYLKILLHVLRNEKNDNRSFAFEQFSQIGKIEHQSVFYYYNTGQKISMYDLSPVDFVEELSTRYKQSISAEDKMSETKMAPEKSEVISSLKPKIFLCHSHEDRTLANDLFNKLTNAGFDPWIDKENIEYGDAWNRVIIDKIKNDIQYFFVINTPNLCKRIESYAHFEIEIALNRKPYFALGVRFIIPIVYNNCQLLPSLKDIQGANAEDNGFFDKLVTTIKVDWRRRGISI